MKGLVQIIGQQLITMETYIHIQHTSVNFFIQAFLNHKLQL